MIAPFGLLHSIALLKTISASRRHSEDYNIRRLDDAAPSPLLHDFNRLPNAGNRYRDVALTLAQRNSTDGAH
jgi:hypothetical protein